jgi:D-glutamate cyclase
MNTRFEFNTSSIAQLSRSLELFIQQDPGGRGLARWAKVGDLFPVALSLLGGDHILISTGYYILSAGTIETDGPLGSVVLAHALMRAGKKVTILSDGHAEKILRTGLDAIGCQADLVTFSKEDPIDYTKVITDDTTHCVALERPGVAADGCHHNFRGLVISDYVAFLDDIFIKCASCGIVTVGIGDGGNELGMGNVSEAVDKYIAPHRAYSCIISSDFCICTGVSNWAGYALAALVSTLCRENFMPDPDTFSLLLEEIVKAGAVDGMTAKPQATVDNLPRSWEDGMYATMYNIAAVRGKA